MRVRAAGLICVNSSILLVKHEKGRKSYWLLPGGGVRVGEKAAVALRRELREELSIECDVRDLLFVVETIGEQGAHLIQPTFEVEATDVDELKIGTDARVRDYGFFDEKGIEQRLIYPNIKSELIHYLRDRTVSQKYLLKQWID